MRLNQTVLGFIFSKFPKKAQQDDTNQKALVETEKSKTFGGQAISRRYALLACILFAVQGFVAVLGAISLVVPDLPSPVPYEYGRSVHLGLATCWPLVGTMGMVYFVHSYLWRVFCKPIYGVI